VDWRDISSKSDALSDVSMTRMDSEFPGGGDDKFDAGWKKSISVPTSRLAHVQVKSGDGRV